MFYTKESDKTIQIIPVIKSHAEQFINSQKPKVKTWLNANDFKGYSGQICLLPNSKGELDAVYLGMADKRDYQALATAASKLPDGSYQLSTKLDKDLLIYWGLAQYQFDRYKTKDLKKNKLLLSTNQFKEINSIVESISTIRDLINTPTEDMGPAQLADHLSQLAEQYNATFIEVVGSDLIEQNFPAIYTVGRAASREPRLLRMHWGDKKHPLICLVGKGVCFDTGGLDLKPSGAMRYMKKDMGGAAHVIGLAQLIMAMNLPIQIEVLIPAVENAVSGDAYRPGDIIQTRKGLTVEIGNTDAEGRVVLADALTLASELKPKLVIDFATLTGAARVALGIELAAMFSNESSIADDLIKLGDKHQDPMWQLPLFQSYRRLIEPEVADLSNSGESSYGGAITAALFLESFVNKKLPWVHFDIMAWNTASKPGKPKGGEALAIRAVYEYLKKLKFQN